MRFARAHLWRLWIVVDLVVITVVFYPLGHLLLALGDLFLECVSDHGF